MIYLPWQKYRVTYLCWTRNHISKPEEEHSIVLHTIALRLVHFWIYYTVQVRLKQLLFVDAQRYKMNIIHGGIDRPTAILKLIIHLLRGLCRLKHTYICIYIFLYLHID